MSDEIRLTLGETHALVTEACRAHGISADHVRTIADTVTAAERDDCKSHGLFRVPGYVEAALTGHADPEAVPVVEHPVPGVVRVDARRGFAPLALEVGRVPLVEKARGQGIAALSIVNTLHFAAVWPEVEVLAAEDGLIAFAFVMGGSDVAPAGGTKPLYGTDPMAFAWPREGRPPLVFDQASAASSRGDIMLHARDGKPIPEGWAIDAEGRPTTDPAAGLAGAQLPFGGYKGAAVGLMVELLAGALAGGALGYEQESTDPDYGGPTVGGELMIAMDPATCAGGRGSPLDCAERLFAKILEQEGTRLPSDRRYAARRRTAVEGITVPRPLYDEIDRLRQGA